MKQILIKLRDHWYEDYGINPEDVSKVLRTIGKIFKYIFIIIMIPTTIIGITGSVFVLSLVYPYHMIIYILFSIILFLYALFRDKLDERYQIL